MAGRVYILICEKTKLQGGIGKGTHNARECVPFGGI